MRQIKSYSRIATRFDQLNIPKVEVPNLLAMQVDSFEEFLQRNVPPSQREEKGLQAVFNNVFPIEDTKGNYRLEFISYNVLKEKYTIEECIERNLTYQAAIKAKMLLHIFDEEDPDGGKREIKDSIEQEVFLGELPLVTQQGTYMINGAERIIISQLHRSPGVYFSEEKHPSGKMLYSCKVIPYVGSWMEMNIDIHDVMYVHIDKRRKLPVSVLLRAIGLSENDDLRKTFYEYETVKLNKSTNCYSFSDIKNAHNEIVVKGGEKLTPELLKELAQGGLKEITIIKNPNEILKKVLESTIDKDPTTTQDEAAKKIYNLIRPGEEPAAEVAAEFIKQMFFNVKKYNLGAVGRYKMNSRLQLDTPLDNHSLTVDDFKSIFNTLINIYNDSDVVDDIDHLSNRRIRTIGELLQEQYNMGLNMVARIARERMAIANNDEVTVHDLVNSNALISVINTFFLTGQLSQYMEQANPLAALTHKRRFSALGPGGLTRERAGFEVRDVHYSHYGRVCPIETPEGANIGLLSSPSIFSRINSLGFLETPYYKVENGKVTGEVEFLDPAQEDNYLIAQINVTMNEKHEITDEVIYARTKGEFVLVPPTDVQYMDVSPQQMVSVSAALVPFLDHDDANRALMGSNMQRQAVPLLNPEAPVVGTSMERIVAKNSGTVLLAPYDGTIVSVTSEYIEIEPDKKSANYLSFNDLRRIRLKKFLRSNQDTCINQRPIVKVGQKVVEGQQLTDGACIEDERLALGTNMLVAFMPWYGYNYEDAIILSENVARRDSLTSIYIEELEVLVRNVKNGKEQLAYDIPNVPVQSLRNLDKTGIIRVGSQVKAGDIIVGKITPKSVEIDPSPEENLMRALFGDRAGDFTNSSLKAKPGMEGYVIDVKVFSRSEEYNDLEEDNKSTIKRLKADQLLRRKRIAEYKEARLSEYLVGEVSKNIIHEKTKIPFIAPDKKITKDDIKRIDFKRLNTDLELVEDPEKNLTIYQNVILAVKNAKDESDNIYKKERDRLKHGDELPYGVRKMVKVYIAKKRKIQVGDKMAGRHGNKGVISIVAPVADMPFMEDGTPVDIVLNPLGVPSRMNIGQIMETHLGMAARTLGFEVETPIFDGATWEDISKELKDAKLPVDGKQVLYDGKTGEPFKERVTVGVIYMMKLNHLVADKMHARSTGPYSLITQQPLGGKAQHGGQRLGEMEVWALEAYGAAHLLEEMLTIKSDDVDGRTNAFKAITSGKNPPPPGVPESFNVLISELQSLGFDIEFIKEDHR